VSRQIGGGFIADFFGIEMPADFREHRPNQT
jgi:hypothetical protein